ncbi:outer membrane beta-barrel protein [Hymenobacter armeniacus]|uniref:Outer membrane beta-barrel protein n=1 Tax=Hymenobacter armeniacus TaxID=2771358 RepID=A0ABR8JNS8_9BACT|nr:outer membrane beta-barrel protein [Hymenobacter armeniacus]MBD2720568.1 outer membrane beta-barrel protein [Hymenobacter armeniacus]
MALPRLALSGLLLAAPLLSRAQSAEPAPAAPRFYVGLAAYHSNYQNLLSSRNGDTGFRVPVQLTAGYQLRPRLALELGAAYSGSTQSFTYDAQYFVNAGGPGPTYYTYAYSNTTTLRTTSVSALARYTLTRKPEHRFQVDALGGLTLIHRSYYSRGTGGDDSSGTFQTAPYSYRGALDDLLLTAGLGLRYRLTPHVGLKFDFATNHDLMHWGTYYQFTGSAALGVQYRFGK